MCGSVCVCVCVSVCVCVRVCVCCIITPLHISTYTEVNMLTSPSVFEDGQHDLFISLRRIHKCTVYCVLIYPSQALFRQQLNNLRDRMNQNNYNSQLYPTPVYGQGQGQGHGLGQGQGLGDYYRGQMHLNRPNLVNITRLHDNHDNDDNDNEKGSRRFSTMQLWEVLKQVDGSLNEEEAKRLAERYTVIQ